MQGPSVLPAIRKALVNRFGHFPVTPSPYRLNEDNYERSIPTSLVN